jgi:GNAT superfamily N-acetyltransferase
MPSSALADTLVEFAIELASVHSPEVTVLLERLTAELAARYDDDGQGDWHPSDMDKPGSGFLLGRWNGQAIACGAYRPLMQDIGEIKRMYVEPAFRGRGIARRLLTALEEAGRQAGYARMWLETGTSQPEAVSLYESNGYRRIEPYGFYCDDPRSLCYEKVLTPP